MFLIVKYFTFYFLIDSTLGYKIHSSLDSIIFATNTMDSPEDIIHSEYYYGKCAATNKILIKKHVYHYDDIKDNLITRVPITVKKEPSCVYIRAKSDFKEAVRYHAFKFNICVCELVYCYSGTRYEHFYYEWYTPVEMMKEIVWELYFYE